MRAIFVGIEYAGKSTLIELLDAYYRHLKLHPHIDDHFTIPDSELSPASRELALTFPDDVKERTQRMQIHYHINILKSYAHVLLAGWHIEEAIYTSVYGSDPTSPYYPGYWYVSGMPRRIPDYPDAYAGWNLISSIGSYVSAAGLILFIYILIYTLFWGKKCAANPWGEGARTLEWTVPSPAPFHTHEELPRVR